ncbi:MAG: nucleotide exchange factor GrpE [Finegoldia sp.]|nr:nucleotide exchange factor GrpE [Finegoldia sp.]
MSQEDMINDEDIKKDDELVDEDDTCESEQESDEVSDLKNSLARLQADFINYKNRVNREKAQSIELANEDLITKLLSILDDLERAIQSEDRKDEFYEGVSLIRENLVNILGDFGLKEIDNYEDFDPKYHHAVLAEESDKDSNKILEVYQKGYLLNNKCIRPAMVKVSK